MSLRQNLFMRRTASKGDLLPRTHSHSPAGGSSISAAPRSGNIGYNNNKGQQSIRTALLQRNNRLLVRTAIAISLISLLLYFGPSLILGGENDEDTEFDNTSRERELQKQKQQQQQQQESGGGGDNAISSDKNNNKNLPCPTTNSFIQKSSFGGAVNPGYFKFEDAIVAGGTAFKFVAIADLDKLSKVEDAKKPTFRADLLSGVLHLDMEDNKYSVSFEDNREISTKQNEGGRGGEYSELTLFDNRLLTFDDRTGAVIEFLNKPDGKSSFPVPRYILTEGNGDNSKGMKWEWATVKNDELYIGGIGKEMQLSNGDVDTVDAMWIAIIGKHGEIRRQDWSSNYNFVRKFLGCQLPGYVSHEAINWSTYLQRWIFLPRRVSTHQYVPDLDERLGSNKVIVVNEEFTDSTVIEIDLEHHEAGLRGFSSFAFVPNTQDQHVLALRSVEEDCVGENVTSTCKFRTYICVFELLTGDVLMEEVLIDYPVKFEGIEFVDINTIPPPPPADKATGLRGIGTANN